MKKLAGRQGAGALQRRARLAGLVAAPLLAVVIVLPGRLQIDPRGSASYLAWYEVAPLLTSKLKTQN